MKKQYVKPEIEVYDLAHPPVLIMTATSISQVAVRTLNMRMQVALLHLQSRQSSAEKSKTPTSNICTFSDK